MNSLRQAGVSFVGGLATFAGTGGTGVPFSLALEVESAKAFIASGICTIAGVAIGKVAENAKAAFNDDVPKLAVAETDKLFAELEANGIKFNREATQWICKTPFGEITWLEIGNDSAGLQHIMLRHSAEFSSWGLNSQEAISMFIENAVKNSTPNVIGAGDSIYNVTVNGVTKQMEVITGSNGFIVTAHPYTP